ncbi:MAG TPA: 2-oxoglutarate and iron-dependent oxygenase domain-containing protein [Gammaproteobacteria bacterium]|nr:2-oxoglutarate and iron-dependent oxygenase domain-containing protein [Gammaproteobacteria bacterium]
MVSLPELDMSGFLADPRGSRGAAFVRALLEACHGPGFCYLRGHGVPPALDRSILAVARRFFALPESERRALAIASSPHFRGYTALGGERTRGASDWREQLDAGPEEEAEALSSRDPAWRRVRGPNQWPPSLPEMRGGVLEWMGAMDGVGLAVLRALALGLGQPLDHFDRYVLPRGDPHIKISRYPAQSAVAGSGSEVTSGSDSSSSSCADGDQGVGWHHDSGLVSFVLQDEVGGLEVEVAGERIEATPRRGTYVMNLGEMLQAATAGFLRATLHRVKSPPPGRARISIAYFFHPRLESIFEPIALAAELAARAPGGQNADPRDPVFSTFGENYLKIRMRSHPDVAARYYADVALRSG